jgi:GUN4-like/TIR domain
MSQFDVFLCHNSKDKAAVIQIALQLQNQGICPWLDDQSIGGSSGWRVAIEAILKQVPAAIVFIGKHGLGPFQNYEIDSILILHRRRNLAVIPVILPDAGEQPDIPLFLESFSWVDFRYHATPIARLYRLIMGEDLKPSTPSNVQPSPTKPSTTKNLRSKKPRENNQAKLRDLLKAGDWLGADQQTALWMCEIMNRQEAGWLRVEDIKRFPRHELKTIADLWSNHSNGKFGFQVQTRIWQECGSPTKYDPNWEIFGDRVGWRQNGNWLSYDDPIFYTNMSEGHFPCLFGVRAGWKRGSGFFGLFSRVQICKV